MNAETRSQFAVLYVDDDEGNRLVFEQTFAPGFQIRLAASGREALEILAREAIAVVVADQRMPEMSGNELLQRVKAAYPDVIRVVLTAYADLDPILCAVNEGLVARYLVKPWTLEEVERLLAWGVDAYRMGKEYGEAQLRLLQLERLATLGSIHAAMVHDISQPLSYISTNIESLKMFALSAPTLRRAVDLIGPGLEPRDAANLRALADELSGICDDVAHGCEMISDMVHSVRRLLQAKSRGPQVLQHPESVLRFATSVCGRALMEAGVELATDIPAALPPIAFGGTELTQVLINVLTNAGQAHDRAPRSDARVDLRVRDEGAWLAFQMQDNGPGMSADVLRQVGTPFFTTRPDGTGLGMSQVRRLVEGARGSVAIESQEGAGTTITIRLPKAV